METAFTIAATRRTALGKSPVRRLRVEGKMPAVMYGPHKDAISLSVDPKAVRTVLMSELGRNTVVTLDIEGTKQLAMIRSFEYHPLSRELEHADFYAVELTRKLRVEVPLLTTGKPVGAIKGGILRIVYRKLPVLCTPDKIPAKVEIDVSGLDLNHVLAVKDLPLPEGVTVKMEASQTIVALVAPEAEVAAVAAPGAPAAAAAAPAKGAAPAKAAAAPAKKK